MTVLRAGDLDPKELLELDPEGGVIRFAGQRALLLDAVAMGLLRKYLVDNFGVTAARTVLTQFGFGKLRSYATTTICGRSVLSRFQQWYPV